MKSDHCRILAAIGPLAVSAALSACTTAPRSESLGQLEAPQAAPSFAYRGIVRPPGAAHAPNAPHAPQAHPLNGSYAPTGSCGSPLTYFGGPIIAAPVVVQVSWNDPGTNGTVASSIETYLHTWWPAIISPEAGYLSWLTEYDTAGKNGVDGQPGSNQTFSGSGTYGGLFHITPAVAHQGATIDDTAIGPEVVAQINAGHLPAPTFDAAGHCNTIYMIDFPPSVTDISMTFAGTTGHSCTDFCGYHGGTMYNGKYIYYGVHPDFTAACTACAPDGLQQDVGMVHSHELGEAMTDAEIGLEALTATSTDFLRPGGWDQIAQGCSEIGDSCAWPSQVGAAVPTVSYLGQSYYVQGLFDNARMDCEVSGPTVAGCTGNASCTNPTAPVCKAGSCQACATNTDCAGNAAGSACQPSGACGQCSATSTSACVAPTPACDTTTGTCVGCTSSAQCGGSKPFCDTGTQTCRGCQASDCSGTTPYCGAGGTCEACLTDANCAGAKPICDTTSHTCRGCASNVDCAGGTNKACDVATGTCVACMKSSDCTSGVCDTTTHACVQCVDDTECSNPAPVCNTSAGTCRACASDGECQGSSSGHACSASGSCVQCTAGNQSGCPSGTKCDTMTDTCVATGGKDGGAPVDAGNPADSGGTVADSGTADSGTMDSDSGSTFDSGTASDDGSVSGEGAAPAGDGGSGSGGSGGGSSGGCAVAATGSGGAPGAASFGGILLGLALFSRFARRRRSTGV